MDMEFGVRFLNNTALRDMAVGKRMSVSKKKRRKKTDSILQSAVIERKHRIMPNPAREMDVVTEKQVK